MERTKRKWAHKRSNHSSTMANHVPKPGMAKATLKPTVHRIYTNHHTELATICDTAKATWIIGQTIDTLTPAFERLGGVPMITAERSESKYWQEHHDIPDIATFATRLTRKVPPAKWVVGNNMENFRGNKLDTIKRILKTAIQNSARQVMICWHRTQRPKDGKSFSPIPQHKTPTHTNNSENSQRKPRTGTHWLNKHNPTYHPKESHQSMEPSVCQPQERSVHSKSHHRRYPWPTQQQLQRLLQYVQDCGKHGVETTFPIHDIKQTAPDLPTTTDMDHIFIRSKDAYGPATIRAEHLALLGFDEEENIKLGREDRIPWKELKQVINAMVPVETWMQTLTGTFFNAKIKRNKDPNSSPEEERQHKSALNNRAINRFTTLPIRPHPVTALLTSTVIPGHLNLAAILWRVLRNRTCPASGVEW